MPTTQERVTDVEFHLAQLAHAQLKTEMALQELSREMDEFKEAGAKDREARARKMDEFKKTMAKHTEKSERDRRNMNKAWGDLANKMGTIIEDIVAPNVRRLAVERFGCEPLERFLVQALQRGPDGVMREFDVIAAGGGRVVLAESKSTITARAVADFVERQRTFFEHFPEWEGRELIPILATWRVEILSHAELNAHRIYGLEISDETMRLVNDGEF